MSDHEDKKEPATAVVAVDNPEYTEYLELCDLFQGERLDKLTVCLVRLTLLTAAQSRLARPPAAHLHLPPKLCRPIQCRQRQTLQVGFG